jgi:hypothetical protein
MVRLLVLLVALILVSSARADLVRSPLENMPQGEDKHWNNIAGYNRDTVQHGFDLEVRENAKGERALPAHALRGVHAKSHGCVKASFTVTAPPAGAPASLRQGIFAVPEGHDPFPAWIRYSNAGGNIQGDKEPDARGMAVKVFIGNELGSRLPDAPEARTQDFTSVNSPVFFVQNAAEDDTLLKQVMDSVLSQSSSAAITRLGHLLGLASFVAKRTGTLEGKEAVQATRPPASFNPLQIQYWSQTPYLLGTSGGSPQAMKYSFRPCAGSRVDAEDVQKRNRKKKNGFRLAMRDELLSGGACFDVLVQLNKDPALPGKEMEIEDTRQEWSTPFYKLAEIRIPSQRFLSADQKDFCDNLAFNPLNSLEAHQPLGWANRVRIVVYRVSSTLRHALNLKRLAEPTWSEDYSRYPDETADTDLE